MRNLFSMNMRISVRFFIPTIVPLVFFILVGAFSIVLYRDNYFTMFDLGVAYRSSYLFLSTHNFVIYPDHFFVAGTLNQKFFYIPLSASLLIFDSPVSILIDQTAIIALGGWAIFHISRHFGLNKLLSAVNQILYFIYPGVYGYLTHGGNFQVYFLGLFLCAYLFYLKKKRLIFLIFAILASITNVLSPIYLVLFYGWITLIYLKKRSAFEGDTLRHRTAMLRSNLYFLVVGLAIFSVLVMIEVHQNGSYLLISNIGGRYVPPVSSPTNGDFLSTIHNIFLSLGLNYKTKLWYFYDMMIPFLFTSLATFTSPFVLLYFLAISYLNYPGFFSLLQQYPYAVMPFIFIGWISFQSSILRSFNKDVKTKPKASYFGKLLKLLSTWMRKYSRKIAYILTIFVIVSSIFSFLLMSPFSVQNIQDGQLKQEFTYTTL